MDNYNVFNDGTNIEQKEYAESTLRNSRDCLSSGYSWWSYQDYYWREIDCFFGLFGLNPWPPYQSEDKVVVEAFENFNPSQPIGTCDEPSSYRDPFNHEFYSPRKNIIDGWIYDVTTNEPINNAYVLGATLLYTDASGKDYYDWHYTFSNSNGYFRLIPYDYIPDCYPNRIEDLRISYPGSTRVHLGWTNPPTDIKPGQTYDLLRNNLWNPWEYNGIIINNTVGGPGYVKFQAFNSLRLKNVHFLSGSNIDVTARNSITLYPEVNIDNGSETHIYPSETFPVCEDTPLDKMGNNKAVRQIDPGTPLSDQIEINFLSQFAGYSIRLYPNPANEFCNLEFSDNSDLSFPVVVDIYNSLGACLKRLRLTKHKNKLDISSLAPGVYYLKISTKTITENKKLVINQ